MTDLGSSGHSVSDSETSGSNGLPGRKGLSKRAFSRPLNQCPVQEASSSTSEPAALEFISSICDRSQGLQSAQISCKEPDGSTHSFSKACVNDEICMMPPAASMDALAPAIAECISRSSFVKLAGDMVQIFAEGIPGYSPQTRGAGPSGGASSSTGQNITYDPSWDSIWDPHSSMNRETPTSCASAASVDQQCGLQSITIDLAINQADWAISNEYSVAALLTGKNGTRQIMAHEFEISAQTANRLGSVKHFRALVNGTKNCTNCESLSLSILPAETMRLRISFSAAMDLLVGAAIYIISMHVVPWLCESCG